MIMLSTTRQCGARVAGWTRYFHLHTEIDIFLMDKAVPQLAGREENMAVAFVANRKNLLNEVNTKQQGKIM